jgi:hypothetical protein
MVWSLEVWAYQSRIRQDKWWLHTPPATTAAEDEASTISTKYPTQL